MRDDKQITFGRVTGNTILENGRACLNKAVKKIKLDERGDDISATGSVLVIRYLDESDQQIDSHEYHTTEFFEMGTTTKVIEDGWTLVGVNLTTDSEGFINWLNFLVWPEGK